jgi:heparin/heparan-sulfate lyase
MNTNIIKKSLIVSGIIASFVVMAGNGWMQDVRKDHPRLFITQQQIPLLKKRAATVCKIDFDRLKREVDALPVNPKLVYRKERFKIKPDGGIKYLYGGRGNQLIKDMGAKNAAKAALVYLVTDDRQYLVKAKNYLKMAMKFFNWCLEHKTITAWYNIDRINALTAYDWIYNSLTPQERREIIVPLLKYIAALQPGKAKFHRCTGGYNDGNYGVRSLMWFAGLAAYGDGFDDKLAGELLRRGYAVHKKMMDYRDKLSSGKGLLSATTTSYSFGAYPYASFLFLHTYKSATGKDISTHWNHMRDYPNWFD